MSGVIHELNLGAGVQSTVLYLLGCTGQLPMDVAIFADPGEEAQETYEHIERLKEHQRKTGGPKIIVASKGSRLGDDLMRGWPHGKPPGESGGRFASIPAFTLRPDGDAGITRRQCSKEYKIEVIERAIREQVVGLKRGQRFPKDVKVVQYIGISLDEAGRARRIEANKIKNGPRWSEVRFPLIEKSATRADCVRYLKVHWPYPVSRSACVFCPYHSDAEWLRIKQSAEDWRRAVEIDAALRNKKVAFNRKLDQELFLHRSCKPLVQIDFTGATEYVPDAYQLNMNYQGECLGVCGL